MSDNAMSRLRICFTSNSSPWSRFSGGGQRVVHELAGGLARRGHDQITSYFAGLDLVGPGVVPVADWRPEAAPDGPYDYVKSGILAGVGRVRG